VLDDARNQQRALSDQIRAAHEAMRAALDAESPSLDAVLAQADSIGALETQSKKIELAALVKVRGLLTDAQWKELRPGPRGSRSPADADESSTGRGGWALGGEKTNT
jgi:Spy/CpxP family protein refolding chaperone